MPPNQHENVRDGSGEVFCPHTLSWFVDSESDADGQPEETEDVWTDNNGVYYDF